MSTTPRSLAAKKRWKNMPRRDRDALASKKRKAMEAYYRNMTPKERTADSRRRTAGQLERWSSVPKAERQAIMDRVRAGEGHRQK